MNREVTNSSELLEDLEVTQEFEKIKKIKKKIWANLSFTSRRLKKITK